MANINLIPQYERVEQTKVKLVKFSTVMAVLLFLVIAGTGYYMYYTTSQLRQEIAVQENQIDELRTEIRGLDNIEINARNLFKKSTTLKNIFNSRKYYSILLNELNSSIPDGVSVGSFTMGKENTINLAGSAQTYNLVQDFTNLILERDIFEQVSLNSVSLDSQDSSVSFFVIVTFNGELLNAR